MTTVQFHWKSVKRGLLVEVVVTQDSSRGKGVSIKFISSLAGFAGILQEWSEQSWTKVKKQNMRGTAPCLLGHFEMRLGGIFIKD